MSSSPPFLLAVKKMFWAWHSLQSDGLWKYTNRSASFGPTVCARIGASDQSRCLELGIFLNLVIWLDGQTNDLFWWSSRSYWNWVHIQNTTPACTLAIDAVTLCRYVVSAAANSGRGKMSIWVTKTKSSRRCIFKVSKVLQNSLVSNSELQTRSHCWISVPSSTDWKYFCLLFSPIFTIFRATRTNLDHFSDGLTMNWKSLLRPTWWCWIWAHNESRCLKLVIQSPLKIALPSKVKSCAQLFTIMQTLTSPQNMSIWCVSSRTCWWWKWEGKRRVDFRDEGIWKAEKVQHSFCSRPLSGANTNCMNSTDAAPQSW